MVIAAGYMGNLPLMLIFSAIASLGMSPLQGDLNALIASCSEYTFLKDKKRIDGTMYSCTSLGVKIGGGIGRGRDGSLSCKWAQLYQGTAAESSFTCKKYDASSRPSLHSVALRIPQLGGKSKP